MRDVHNSKKENFCLGIDIGSISADFALIGENQNIIKTSYHRIKGQPIHKTLEVLQDEFSDYLQTDSICLSFTGTGGQILSNVLSCSFINEIIAQMRAVTLLYPKAKTIIEIGGEDSKLILLDHEASSSQAVLKDFAMNMMCAAGTGSFLDQQASRLGVSIEDEFSELALKSKTPARLAGRCSVFAKSDMIHLQQEATPDCDIIAGLCQAMVRNFKGTIGKGKQFQKPIVFQGGVAANRGMVKAMETVLGLGPGELIIPKYYNCMGAIGAAFIVLEKPNFIKGNKVVETIKEYLGQNHHKSSPLPALHCFYHQQSKAQKNNIPEKTIKFKQKTDVRQAFLGIDVGSISTNVVVIDTQKKVLSKRYLMTAGRPIEAVRKGLEEVGQEVKDLVHICGVGTTGSGRYLIGDFVGADIIKNEITAQAKAAFLIDPQVDTIFEIGGQDSKYISLDQGAVVDFEMNKVCAAGTGSFLEEQAEKLEINIKKEFETMALSSPCPVKLGERCTVFMESDLVHHQQKGAAKGDLVAGLSYSIVNNYLNRVVAGRKIGRHIFFQGGVAFNKSVVAAFQQVLEKQIIVPDHHEVTGAIGAALIAQEEQNWTQSKFKGFDLSKRHYSVESFECQGCANHCQIKKVTLDLDRPLFYGSRCDKYDEKKGGKSQQRHPDLFAFRAQELYKSYFPAQPTPFPHKKKVGIPLCLFFHELLPFWRTFFEALGLEVVLSQPTNKEIITQGVQTTVADTCFPIKVTHGHVLNLLQKGIDYIFLPSIINMPPDHSDMNDSFNCPYVQTIPYTVCAAIDIEKQGVELLKPVIFFQKKDNCLPKGLIDLGQDLEKSKAKVTKAFNLAQRAQNFFYTTLQKKGEEIIKRLPKDEKTIVLISRPYNGFDYGLNLEIPKILQDMGFLIIPMDFLALQQNPIADEWPNMYWRYGQRILSAANIIRTMPNCHAVYITNFSCGPDSFITQFFQNIMKERPYLQIEIDEHSAGAGIITRCEAFVDSLKMQSEAKRPIKSQVLNHPAQAPFQEKPKDSQLNNKCLPSRKITQSSGPFGQPLTAKSNQRTLYIPHMSEHAHAICSAFRSQGISAEVMPEPDEETIYYGRMYTSGKECYPCLITTGDMIKIVQSSDFTPTKYAFFMPSGDGPCRFGQYYRFQRMVLDQLGFQQVPIYAPNQGESFYNELGIISKKFSRLAWQGIVVIDYLEKWLLSHRPYEKIPGEADKIYQKCLSLLCHHMETKNSVFPVLKKIYQPLASLRLKQKTNRPIIGIVGEIFIRSNRFSNNDLIREMEHLGAEIRLAPVSEWFHYINYTAKERSFKNKNFKNLLSTTINDFVQKKDEEKIYRQLCALMPNGREPSTKKLLKHSRPYLHSSFEGEAILTIGKSIDLVKKNISGIINVMPFTCMPGNISTGILKKVRDDYKNFPFLNLAYDGLEDTTIKTRLEAFVHQTRQFKNPFKRPSAP